MTEHYLDNSATTPLCDATLSKMTEVMTAVYGNPSSLHTLGVKAEEIMTEARKKVLAALCPPRSGVYPKPENLIFTASGTEANNLALMGTALAKPRNRGKKIIVGETEHPSVIETAKHLEALGFKVAYIPSPKGVWDMDAYKKELSSDTILVSAMLVNNETGAVNDIEGIAALAREISPDVLLHCDDVQGFLKTESCPAVFADMVTVSAHKIGGPKGVGALYVNGNVLKKRALSPVIFGGGQERGFRSGTENMIGIAGFGAAAEAEYRGLSGFLRRASLLRERLKAGVADLFASGVRINEPSSAAIAPHIISLTAEGIRSETLLHSLSRDGVYVSSGSACSSNGGHKSYVLSSFGLSDAEADSTIRISLGVQNSEEDVDAFCLSLHKSVAALAKK